MLKNSSNIKDYGTYISDYSSAYNTDMIIHDGTVKIVRTDTSGSAITYNLISDDKTCYPKPTSGAASLASTNINSHRIISIIALNAADTASVSNLPVQARGILRTTVAGAYCTQEYFTDAKLYCRMYNGDTWSSWG